jgi:hypothetical protein
MGESASVEVLSAEVRVLQVGDGQITLSMYRQLDEATFEWFEPFGRVRENERNPKDGVLQLVGRDTKTGALVRYDAQRLTGHRRRGRRNLRTGCSTLSNPTVAGTRFPMARTGAAWSGW